MKFGTAPNDSLMTGNTISVPSVGILFRPRLRGKAGPSHVTNSSLCPHRHRYRNRQVNRSSRHVREDHQSFTALETRWTEVHHNVD